MRPKKDNPSTRKSKHLNWEERIKQGAGRMRAKKKNGHFGLQSANTKRKMVLFSFFLVK